MKDNQQPSLVFKELKEDSDYLIYSDGRLFSRKTNKFLNGKIDNSGYRMYALNYKTNDKRSISNRKLSKMVYAHRLVAEYFIPNPNNLSFVHHKDENKLNNHVENLEWISPKDNYKEYLLNNGRKAVSPVYLDSSYLNEEWIDLYIDDLYSISSFGRIINKKTKRLIKCDNSQKYVRVSLRDKKHYYLHRLVYCSFTGDINLEGYVIDHIDSNTKNNALNNLQKITQQENCLKQGRFNDYRKHI